MARIAIERNISYDAQRKKYYVTMDYGKDQTGKRIKKMATFKTKAEAKKALKIFEANKETGDIVKPQQMKLSDWLEYWMNYIIKPNREKTTVYGYQKTIENHINPALGNILIQKLTPQNIQMYYIQKLNNSKAPLSSNTLRHHHDILKAALKVAVRQDVITRNPLDRVEPPRIMKAERAYYTTEDLSKLFELIKGDRLESTVKLAGYLGLRREEICGLKWECIDFENKTLHIMQARTTAGSTVVLKGTKNKSSDRILHMPDDLLNVLLTEKRKQDEYKMLLGGSYYNSGYVVQWPDGRPYRPNYISELFTKFIKRERIAQNSITWTAAYVRDDCE